MLVQVLALEVYRISGRPFSDFVNQGEVAADFVPLFLGLTMDRTELYRRIDQRAELMVEHGLIDESRALLQRGYPNRLNAFQTVGYKEAFDYLAGKLSRPEMISQIKQKTRNYAKRQLTWFRKDQRIHWIDLLSFSDVSKAADFVTTFFLSSPPGM